MSHRRFRDRIWVLGSFLRLPLVGWSLAMPFLGILSVPYGVSYSAIVPILMVVPFHVVMGVVNDLATIDLDKEDPRKVQRPLVSGAVKPSTAKLLVLVVVVTAFPADAALLGFDAVRSATLAIAFVGTAAYNLFGKRTRVPPLMDFLLGIGSAAFVHYTMLAIHGAPTTSGVVVEVAVVLYVTLNNGVHFGVRDIEVDHGHGARTTPIALGVRATNGAHPFLPLRFIVYACALQVLLTLVTLVPVLIGFVNREVDWMTIAIALVFAIGCYSFIYPAMYAHSASSRYFNAYLQCLCGVGSITALAAAKHGGFLCLFIFAVVLAPLFAKQTARGLHDLLIRVQRPSSRGHLRSTTGQRDGQQLLARDLLKRQGY